MSTIMRALRRLEQERERRVETQRLHGEVVAPSLSPSRMSMLLSRGAWGIGLLLILLGLGSGAAWWWLGMPGLAGDGPTAQTPVVATQLAGTETSSTRPRDDGSKIPGRIPVAPPPPARAAERESERQRVAAAAPIPRATRPVPAEVPARRAVPIADPVAKERDLTSAAPAPARPQPPIARARKVTSLPEVPPIEHEPPVPEPAPRTEPSPEQPRVPGAEPKAAPAPKPKVSPVPKAARASKSKPQPSVVANLTPFAVVRTVWHPKPEKRIAQVASADGKKVEVHEGDVYEGLVVEEIQLSSVIFRDGDVTFSRRVSARRSQR
ncbi:MAG: hypothetical protein JRH16_19580 [Deltaproteobacteria bacterium]|nr:hypothetical protein [Deltaproteobacteria bacterium]MBW2697714.1 hypothetical protein [Deltaproteobacteria bacterium]